MEKTLNRQVAVAGSGSLRWRPLTSSQRGQGVIMGKRLPAYLEAHGSGRLAARVETARRQLASCCLCPQCCKVNRLKDEKGVCRTGLRAVVANYGPHFGEETPLVGSGGSGTIFISNCNLLCVFCQNYGISHGGEGAEVTDDQLATMMISLQDQGCHNINFVTPSHVVPQILAGLKIAAGKGLHVPLVYNSSGYDSLATLRLLEGVVDIYMPDFKFWDPLSAKLYAAASDYPERARAAIGEMYRQVGELVMDEDGIAVSGLLVRHLVMPGGLAETGEIMRFIARELSSRTYVNVMDQYRPCGRASRFPPIDRFLTSDEHREALRLAAAAGLTRLDHRDWPALFRHLGVT